MIGGTDITIPTTRGPEALDACARIFLKYWPRARFEDALTGRKYGVYRDLPFGEIRELFVYPDAPAEASWDADSPDSPPNSMIYLILSPVAITMVLDDPTAAAMRPILNSIRGQLRLDILTIWADLAPSRAA